jgi:hypothetical protein
MVRSLRSAAARKWRAGFFTLAAPRRRRDCAVQGWIVTSVSNLTVNFSQLSVVIVYAIT